MNILLTKKHYYFIFVASSLVTQYFLLYFFTVLAILEGEMLMVADILLLLPLPTMLGLAYFRNGKDLVKYSQRKFENKYVRALSVMFLFILPVFLYAEVPHGEDKITLFSEFFGVTFFGESFSLVMAINGLALLQAMTMKKYKVVGSKIMIGVMAVLGVIAGIAFFLFLALGTY